MTQESICRVLIVDNELEYAAETAAKLSEIRPSLLNHNKLEIELTNNAYFAAERLRSCAAGAPPWDIIISDVYMPFPGQSGNPDVPELEAAVTHYQHDGKAWRSWEFPYPSGNLVEKIENGGFYIAETIAARLSAQEDMAGLKMILMSNCLEGEDRERILYYQSSRSSWLRYYDKADWKRDKVRTWPREELTTWPTHQSPPDIFQWALVVAIAGRQQWGRLTYERFFNNWEHIREDSPDVDAVMGRRLSKDLERVLEDIWRVGEANIVDVVFITGEVGTGRDVFAKMIHKIRMLNHRTEGQFAAIDCSAISDDAFPRELFDYVEEAEGGTLFVDEVDQLSPPHQGKIYHLIKDKKLRGFERPQTLQFGARLTICAARRPNFENLHRAKMFHDDLYYLLRDVQLRIPPLRERPEDAVSIAEVLAHQTGPGLTLSDDAREWIKAYHWPGNNKELQRVITAAVLFRPELTSVLTAEDFVYARARVSGGATSDQNAAAEVQKEEVAAKNTGAADREDEQYVFRQQGEIWTIAYEGKKFPLNDIKGLHYIACLLREPGREFSVQHFTALTDGLPLDERGDAIKSEVANYGATSDLSNSHMELDPQALREYTARLKLLNKSLEIAQGSNNTTRIRELNEEINFIKEEFAEHAAATRPSKTDVQEKTRTLVYNNYHRALDKIIAQSPLLGLHLKNSIRTGRTYVYLPDIRLPWTL